MKIFKNRQVNQINSESGTEKIAVRIVNRILEWQRKISWMLDKRFAKVSVQKLKIYLVAFCMASGGVSLYFIISGLLKNEKRITVFNIEQARMPIRIDSNNQYILPVIVDEATWQKIKSFKNYLDSLKANERKEYDSLIAVKPGLLDSIKMIEEMYYSQK